MDHRSISHPRTTVIPVVSDRFISIFGHDAVFGGESEFDAPVASNIRKLWGELNFLLPESRTHCQ